MIFLENFPNESRNSSMMSIFAAQIQMKNAYYAIINLLVHKRVSIKEMAAGVAI